MAPQAPYDPRDGKQPNWSWEPYLETIRVYLNERYGDRRRLATGFSRGGMGVLQLLCLPDSRIERWAVVDPQCPPDTKRILRDAVGDAERNPGGWLAFGTQFDSIERFSRRLSRHLCEENVRFTELRTVDPARRHGELARRVYAAEDLEEEPKRAGQVYEFLGLDFA